MYIYSFICLCVCGVCSQVLVGAQTTLFACVGKPEVKVKCLPHLISNVYFETRPFC